ncbi:MAG: hypothetical protein PVH55_11115 [Desulfobacterales bacterium]|jgi:hypothetical protein
MVSFSLMSIIVLAVVFAFLFIFKKGIRWQIARGVKKEIMNNGGEGVPCPYCAKQILSLAQKCPFCGSHLIQLA